MKQIHIKLSENTKVDFSKKCKSEKRSMQKQVELLIENFLKQKNA